MIALLIGGTVVLCMGLLAVVYGVPIKEFSFGNTMILAGSIVACTGLMLIGLSFVGRELRNLTRRLESGIAPAAVPVDMPVALPAARPAAAPREDLVNDAPQEMPPVRPALRSPPDREDTLFASEQPFEPEQDRFYVDRRTDPVRDPTSPLESPASAPAKPAERVRRNIMFSSHRRDSKNPESSPRDDSETEFDALDEHTPADDARDRDSSNAFAAAWPQSGRTRSEQPLSPSGRITPPLAEPDDHPEPQRERFQPPRRADASSVTIVKSGVVDSMAYSLYSDGSIEAQMPEGTVRFASIDELRAHLDQRN